MSTAREATPPPVIGKLGQYTVFITPPATPRPSSEGARSQNPSPGPSPKLNPRNAAPSPSQASRSVSASPRESTRSGLSPRKGDSSPAFKAPEKPEAVPPPVQVPPPQFEKGKGGKSSGSVFGFFWDAVAKVQDAHSSLDQYFADWLGLDQSRYQWALNDYYENNGAAKDGGKPKELVNKGQAV